MNKYYISLLLLQICTSWQILANDPERESEAGYVNIQLGFTGIPLYQKELAIGYHYFYNSIYGLALDARIGLSSSAYQISGNSIGIDNNIQLGIRAVRSVRLSSHHHWLVQVGANVNSVKINYTRFHPYFKVHPEYYEVQRSVAPGISIMNQINVWKIFGVYLYHTINTKYSYTALGVQIDFNRKYE